jgi:uncharacterized protein YdeI (YjbR/CyaY-like superfamily)
METHKGFPTFYAKDQKAWHNWLLKHHETEKSVWLILYNKGSEVPCITYDEALEEALCFGWIDSVANKRDRQSRYLYCSQRKPKSNWSRVNKVKVEKLLAEGRMKPAGMAMIELAKRTGTWTALDEVENLVVPADLAEMFERHPPAAANWEAFPRSAKRGILEWIGTAKSPETRLKRITETATLAARNERANQFKPKK